MTAHPDLTTAVAGDDAFAEPTVAELEAVEAELELDDFDGSGADLDGFGRYLKTMAREPLLTSLEELQLGRKKQLHARLREQGKTDGKIGEARYMELVSEMPYEERRRIPESQAAFDRLYRANLRLVVSVAKKVGSPALIEDRVQDGNIGLMRAVERFDPERGIRFSTYATFWIRQAILRGMDDQTAVRFPAEKGQLLRRYEATLIKVQERSGRTLRGGELERAVAEEMQVSIDTVREWDRWLVQRQPTSLNLEIGEKGDALGSFQAGPETDDPAVAVAEALDAQEIADLLGQLPEDYRRVLQLRYLGETQRPREQVAAMFGQSKEHVARLEREAAHALAELLHGGELGDVVAA